MTDIDWLNGDHLLNGKSQTEIDYQMNQWRTNKDHVLISAVASTHPPDAIVLFPINHLTSLEMKTLHVLLERRARRERIKIFTSFEDMLLNMSSVVDTKKRKRSEEEFDCCFGTVSVQNGDDDVHAKQLFENGYLVLKLLPETLTADIIQREFQETVRAMPEFSDEVRSGQKPTTLGGFAALNNPSSFHNPFVKKYRTDIYLSARAKVVAPFIRLFQQSAGAGTPYAKQYADNVLTAETEWSTQILMDRMMHRRAGQSPTAESWHRDIVANTMLPVTASKRSKKTNESTGAEANDLILGGWTNLTDHNQYFSCLPRSHFSKVGDIEPARLLEIGSSGFDVIKKKTDLDYCKQHKQIITIKPLHTLFFFQHLLHEVHSNKSTHDQYRLFHGLRITPSTSVLFKEQYRDLRTFEEHGPILLPSGQLPRMYSKNHGACFLGLFTPDDWKRKEWYETFRDNQNEGTEEDLDSPPTESLDDKALTRTVKEDVKHSEKKNPEKAISHDKRIREVKKTLISFKNSSFGQGTYKQFKEKPEWKQADFNSNPENKRLKTKFRVLGLKEEPETNLVYWCRETFSPAVQATFETKEQSGTNFAYKLLSPVLPSLDALGLPKATESNGRALYAENKVPFELELHALFKRNEA